MFRRTSQAIKQATAAATAATSAITLTAFATTAISEPNQHAHAFDGMSEEEAKAKLADIEATDNSIAYIPGVTPCTITSKNIADARTSFKKHCATLDEATLPNNAN